MYAFLIYGGTSLTIAILLTLISFIYSLPPCYSVDISNLISQLMSKSPEDRPRCAMLMTYFITSHKVIPLKDDGGLHGSGHQ